MKQYNHIRKTEDGQIQAKGGMTVCIDLTSFKENIADKRVGDLITLPVGWAACSNRDLYNKRIGRQISNDRIVPYGFTVLDIFNVCISNHLIDIYIIEALGMTMQITVGKKARFVDCILGGKLA